MSEEEIEKLVKLDQSDFKYKEWVALRYVREWIFSGGKAIDAEYMADYRKLYSEQERKYILKLVRFQHFLSRFMHLFRKTPWRKDLDMQAGVCSIIDKE